VPQQHRFVLQSQGYGYGNLEYPVPQQLQNAERGSEARTERGHQNAAVENDVQMIMVSHVILFAWTRCTRWNPAATSEIH
jgi:hypothetical protein